MVRRSVWGEGGRDLGAGRGGAVGEMNACQSPIHNGVQTFPKVSVKIPIGSLETYVNKLSNSSIHQRNSLFRGKMAQAAMDETLYELSERLPYEINLKPEQRE